VHAGIFVCGSPPRFFSEKNAMVAGPFLPDGHKLMDIFFSTLYVGLSLNVLVQNLFQFIFKVILIILGVMVALIILLFFLLQLWKSNHKKQYILLHNTLKFIIVSGVFSIVLINPNVLIHGKNLLKF
jgi:hypothetical protein